MSNRNVPAGLLLLAAALAPGFLAPGAAAAQDQTKGKHSDGKRQTMTLEQLPQPVQQTIHQEAHGGTVGTIKQESRRGKTLYVAEITDQHGKKHHVRVNEDGSLVTAGGAHRNESNSKSSSDRTPGTK